ncbi:MAG: adenylyltransferase/cytidyltransferase family protein [Candidatus Woesebacteria bacterium]|jgi:rfaE bifunctional protein nucleotidyltransferase chain/domain
MSAKNLASEIPQGILNFVHKVHQEKKKLIFVTGTFDVLHFEHKRFLKKAKAAGDYLLVGLESDKRVKQTKGEARPVNRALTRLKNLKKLKIADEVFILPEEFSDSQQHEELLKIIRPAVLAVSSHSPFLAKKKQLLKKINGRVIVVHEFNPNVSTSKLIRKMEL